MKSCRRRQLIVADATQMFSFPPASAAYAPSNYDDILRALESALNDVLRTQPVRPLPALASLVEDPNLPPSSPRHSAGPHTLSDTLQKYIQKHQLSERVEQALNNVLAERPRDARRGLADALRRAPCIFEPELQSLLRRATPAGSRALRCEDALVRLAGGGQHDEVRKLLRLMAETERPLNEGTYDPLLRAAKQRGDWREALELLVQAKELRLEPQSASYNLVLQACAQAQQRRACQMLLDQMSKKAASPDVESRQLLQLLGIDPRDYGS